MLLREALLSPKFDDVDLFLYKPGSGKFVLSRLTIMLIIVFKNVLFFIL